MVPIFTVLLGNPFRLNSETINTQLLAKSGSPALAISIQTATLPVTKFKATESQKVYKRGARDFATRNFDGRWDIP
jgi:tryptophanase